MNNLIRIVIKISLTILILFFFSGVFRGCGTSEIPLFRGLSLLSSIIIFMGILYGIWSYKPKKDIKLDKD
jgi:hypothetical protein